MYSANPNKADSTIAVIILTALRLVEEAVSDMKDGAFDFIQKTVDLDSSESSSSVPTAPEELLRENLIFAKSFRRVMDLPRIVGEYES